MTKDKDLPPEERIKKLKELKKQKEKEIAEAQKKIKESEEEISDREKLKEKVPIPESAQEDLEGLSREGKDIVKEQRGLHEGKSSRDNDLESLARGRVELPPEVLQSQYTEELSREPIGDLYQEMGNIYKAVEEKGYLNQDEMKRVEYLMGGVEQKMEDGESGNYSFSEKAARAASITRQMGTSLMNSYKSNKDNKGRMYSS